MFSTRTGKRIHKKLQVTINSSIIKNIDFFFKEIVTGTLLFSNITVHCIFIFIISEHPEFYDAQKEKNKDLVERLKQVHVVSHGTTKDVSLMTDYCLIVFCEQCFSYIQDEKEQEIAEQPVGYTYYKSLPY